MQNQNIYTLSEYSANGHQKSKLEFMYMTFQRTRYPDLQDGFTSTTPIKRFCGSIPDGIRFDEKYQGWQLFFFHDKLEQNSKVDLLQFCYG